MVAYGLSPGAGSLMELPLFGIGHLNVRQAAELATIDRWYSGEIERVSEPEDWDGEPSAPWLREKLAPEIDVMEAQLLSSVAGGKLKPAKLAFDFDDHVISADTWIDYEDLHQWLQERGYQMGDIGAGWIDEQSGVLGSAEDAVRFLQVAAAEGKRLRADLEMQGLSAKLGTLDEADPVALSTAVRALVVENAGLRKTLESRSAPLPEEKPLAPRERGSLLRVIRALDVMAKLPERGAAVGLLHQLEQLGFTSGPGDTTIRKTLEQARALEPDKP